MSLAPEIVSYVFRAFPNASGVLEEILKKYAGELTPTVAFGLVALWEFIYDRLFERNPETIHITSASEKIGETSSSGAGPASVSPPNGYSPADKSVLEKLRENSKEQPRKNQLRQYEKQGTLEDAYKYFQEFSGNTKQVETNVWIKYLPHGKRLTVRQKKYLWKQCDNINRKAKYSRCTYCNHQNTIYVNTDKDRNNIHQIHFKTLILFIRSLSVECFEILLFVCVNNNLDICQI